MCGIFGSYQFRRYEQLYNINKKRGNFSCGSLYTSKTTNPGVTKDTYIRKREGIVDLTGDYAFCRDYDQFLGHTQSPTGSQRDFSPVTTHPFNSIHYIVAHNGVLENTRDIITKYIGDHNNPVDSSTIPILISYMIEFNDDVYDIDEDEMLTPEVLAIQEACEQIKGTFSCWIYSKLTGASYLVRSGSTLFANIETGDFSSIQHDVLCNVELEQGVIYCITNEGLATCGRFKTNNSFFI